MKIEARQGNKVISTFFRFTKNFIKEYEDGFKHNNKKIEEKFNKVGKDLKKICKFKY